ncbi:hypothetical protein DFA_02836 [Cavenderia fasciculata]|uniref:Uncharacterized protein n=1 Tax=Cavenderia fasciculata TaxID=261658 RepID=F4PIL3_CACFS|nr:uncharacterized protein DFA_02836 [Cavenderia fasciculata]EGG24593.1 hypothetical protein DFA_02836 [Cavenderia fasciculata]|eukprot:XP_004362444.1 hypothetical protein DFA_02836 [Cavenderia fasciculata]
MDYSELPSITPIPIGENGQALRSLQLINETEYVVIAYASGQRYPFSVAQDGTLTKDTSLDPSNVTLGRRGTTATGHLLQFESTVDLVYVVLFISLQDKRLIHLTNRSFAPGSKFCLSDKHVAPDVLKEKCYHVYDENYQKIIPTPLIEISSTQTTTPPTGPSTEPPATEPPSTPPQTLLAYINHNPIDAQQP